MMAGISRRIGISRIWGTRSTEAGGFFTTPAPLPSHKHFGPSYQGLTLQLGAGAEYLSGTPKMHYANLGERFASGDPHSPARIEYSDAYGYFGTFSIVAGL